MTAQRTLNESPTPSEQLDARDGLIAGRFEIVRPLGDGAFAVVYEAIDRDLERRVALKLFTSYAPDELDSALREARAMARLNHENVLSVHDIGQHRGTPFLALEHARTDLSRWLVAEPRDIDEILQLFFEAGSGLAAAHAAGLVHHDFKPANVLLRDNGSVAVGDFGLARHLDSLDSLGHVPARASSDGLDLDQDRYRYGDDGLGFTVGTLRYIAPERLLGQTGDDRSDQFSFCVALWEALAGEHPFVGADASRRYDSIAAGPAGTPQAPAHVIRALRRGLSLDAPDRFESMDALLVALRRARPGAPGPGWLRRSLRPAVTAVMLSAVFVLGVGLSRDAPALDVAVTPAAVLTIDAALDEARQLTAAGDYAKTVPLLMNVMPVVREADVHHQLEYLAQLEILGDLLSEAGAFPQATMFYAAGNNLAQDLGADPTRLLDKRSTMMAMHRRLKRATATRGK